MKSLIWTKIWGGLSWKGQSSRIKLIKLKIPLIEWIAKKQHIYMRRLNKTAKLEYFNNLKLGKDNKPFREKWQLYLTNKHSKADTDIILNENGQLLLKNKDDVNTFNEYFGSIFESLDLYNGKEKLVIWV